jgi:hypothetical protein
MNSCARLLRRLAGSGVPGIAVVLIACFVIGGRLNPMTMLIVVLSGVVGLGVNLLCRHWLKRSRRDPADGPEPDEADRGSADGI